MATSKLMIITIGSIALAAFVASTGDRLADVGEQQADQLRSLLASGSQKVEAALTRRRAVAEEDAFEAAHDTDLIRAVEARAKATNARGHARSLEGAGDPPSIAEVAGRIELEWTGDTDDAQLAVVDAGGGALLGKRIVAAVGRERIAGALAGKPFRVTVEQGGQVVFAAAAPVSVGGQPLGAVVVWQPLERLPAIVGADEMLIVNGAVRLGRLPSDFKQPRIDTTDMAPLAPSSAGESVLADTDTTKVWGARFDVPGTAHAHGYVFADIGAVYQPLDELFWLVSIAAAAMWVFLALVVALAPPRARPDAGETEPRERGSAKATPPPLPPRIAANRHVLRSSSSVPPAPAGKRRRRSSYEERPTAQVAVDNGLLALSRFPDAEVASATTHRLVRRDAQLRRLYEQFMRARRRAGVSAPLSLDDFAARILQIRARISAEHEGAPVTFYVVEKPDGRVSIRAVVPGLDRAVHNTYVGAPPPPRR